MRTLLLAPDAVGIARGAALLRAGGLVAFPTETVYGLGANAADPSAVARVYAAKGRPADNPLIVHVPSAESIAEWAVPDERARELCKRFWPGPLTLVLPGRGLMAAKTLALRMPRHEHALSLLRAADRPIAAPSANRSGRPSPTSASAALSELGGRIEAVLDGQDAEVGIESTVLDLTEPQAAILRPGGISSEEIGRVLGAKVGQAARHARSPGVRYRHYAPDVDVLLLSGDDRAALRAAAERALSARGGSWYIGLADTAPAGARGLVAASVSDLQQALYAALLRAEREGAPLVAVLPPASPDAAGVIDRMVRAAGKEVRAREDLEE